jgi:hypothetical protein
MKDVLNAGGALNHKSGSVISGGAFVITSTPSVKDKAGGLGVFPKEVEFTFSGGSASGCVPGTVATAAPVKIPATAIKSKTEGFPPVRLGDFVTMSALGDNPTPPPPKVAVAGPVEVSDAGQTKVKAN